jgi:hypothetical protein
MQDRLVEPDFEALDLRIFMSVEGEVGVTVGGLIWLEFFMALPSKLAASMHTGIRET